MKSKGKISTWLMIAAIGLYVISLAISCFMRYSKGVDAGKIEEFAGDLTGYMPMLIAGVGIWKATQNKRSFKNYAVWGAVFWGMEMLLWGFSNLLRAFFDYLPDMGFPLALEASWYMNLSFFLREGWYFYLGELFVIPLVVFLIRWGFNFDKASTENDLPEENTESPEENG